MDGKRVADVIVACIGLFRAAVPMAVVAAAVRWRLGLTHADHQRNRTSRQVIQTLTLVIRRLLGG